MKFSACIEALFSDREFTEGMELASQAGLSAYEFWGWWNKDLKAIRSKQDELGLTPAAFCTRFASLVDPTRRNDYLEGLKTSIEAAHFLGCKTLITQVGNELPGVSRDAQVTSLIEGLRACIPLLTDAGITLVYEPLNTKVNHKGYFLYSSDEALFVAEQVDSPSVKILFDFYHQQIMEGDLTRNVLRLLPHVGHVHCAGNPGRNELDIGEIRYDGLFDALDEAGYAGYAGLEYWPTRDVMDGLRELAERQYK